MKDFPLPLETERLILRRPSVDDAPALNEAIIETLEQLKPWMEWAQQAPTLEDSIEVCTRMTRNWQEGHDFVIFGFQKGSGRFILGTGCHRYVPSVPSAEIGYWCRTSEQGNGYVTEAVKAISSALFRSMEMRRVEIRCDSENLSSRRVAELAGFRLEAELRNHRRNTRGRLSHTLIYALAEDD